MSEVFVGQVMLGGFNFAPRGFAFCNGQLLPVSQNTALFSLLGTIYGGDGKTTFALPDLRGRLPQGFGSSVPIGERGGTELVTLTDATMPAHSHAFMGTSATGSARSPDAALYGVSSGEEVYGASSGQQVAMTSQTIGQIGGDQAHDNMQPYQAINFSIALVGIYPSRS